MIRNKGKKGLQRSHTAINFVIHLSLVFQSLFRLPWSNGRKKTLFSVCESGKWLSSGVGGVAILIQVIGSFLSVRCSYLCSNWLEPALQYRRPMEIDWLSFQHTAPEATCALEILPRWRVCSPRRTSSQFISSFTVTYDNLCATWSKSGRGASLVSM